MFKKGIFGTIFGPNKDTPTSLRIILKVRYQKTKPNCVMKASPSTPTQTVIMRGNGMPHNISEPTT